MARPKIAAKPRSKRPSASDEAALDAIISQGAGFPGESSNVPERATSRSKSGKRLGRPPSRVKKTKVLLSLPDALLEKLDNHLDAIDYPGSRSDWFRIAIESKLNDEFK